VEGRIFVFGANGYIGRHIVHKLLSESRSYTLELSDRQRASLDGYKFYQKVDVRSHEAVRSFLQPCDYVFYFSGLNGPALSFENYRGFVETNEIGLLNVLDACRRQGLQCKVIFPSSRLIYEGKKDLPLYEDDEKDLKTIYAINKNACEHYLKVYGHNFGLKYLILRISVPYGSMHGNQKSLGTINNFLSQAKDKGEVIIFGNGEQKRSFIHIEDLVSLIVKASFNPRTENDIFNIGGPDTLSIRYVAEKIAQKFGATVKTIPWPTLDEKIETGDTVLATAKIESFLDVKYMHRFDDWLDGLKV
jgi:UDP-glucose 4-epimerase